MIIETWTELTNDLFRQVGSKVKAWPLTSGRVIFTGSGWAIIVDNVEYQHVDGWLEWLAEVQPTFRDSDVRVAIQYAQSGLLAPGAPDR